MRRKPVIKVKMNRGLLLIFILVLCCIVLTGCWNYREVEQLAIAAGAAIDLNEDGTESITIEIVSIAGDGQVTYEPVLIETTGKTFFDAVRRGITIQGKKIYWSHAKAIILSQEIAKQDVTKYLDFLFRDAEAREDAWLLVSMEKTAKEVLQTKGMLRPIVSFELDDMMRSQRSISRFPQIEIFEFFDRLFYEQVSPILPTVRVIEQKGTKTPQIEGTAVFNGKKMVDVLGVSETKGVLWLRDEVEGGLIVVEDVVKEGEDVTLEIYRSKSKITPMVQDNGLKMKVDIDLVVNIAEIEGPTDFISSSGQQKLKEIAEKQLEKDIMDMYTKVRDEHKSDIFGFGRRIDMKLPQVWSQIKDNWREYYSELELEVNANIKIRGSATTRTPLKEGE